MASSLSLSLSQRFTQKNKWRIISPVFCFWVLIFFHIILRALLHKVDTISFLTTRPFERVLARRKNARKRFWWFFREKRERERRSSLRASFLRSSSSLLKSLLLSRKEKREEERAGVLRKKRRRRRVRTRSLRVFSKRTSVDSFSEPGARRVSPSQSRFVCARFI